MTAIRQRSPIRVRDCDHPLGRFKIDSVGDSVRFFAFGYFYGWLIR